ncbi:hypothetical protein QEM33_004036 [Pseudomonas putida]|nr:hypothetical protein [Pseudomonas putida]
MSLFSANSGKDVIYIERNGERQGPYKCRFASPKMSLFYKELDLEDGDTIVRELHGKEQAYTVLEVGYSHGLGGIPPHYTVNLTKVTAIQVQPRTATNHITIHGSTGIQIGDHNVQHLQAAMKEVLAAIESAHASPKDKAEAKGLLSKFLEHPLVSAAVGAGLPAALGLVG